MNQSINPRLLEQQIMLHEGFALEPYRCPAGKLTIGAGRNLDEVGLSMSELTAIQARRPEWKVGDPITTDEALLLLRNDLARVDRELTRVLPGYARLTDRRQMALLDMGYNLGLSKLLKFKRMLAALVAGDFNRAAKEMLASAWAGQVGQRAHALAEMMREG